ncbi:GNAT family N-acetyltransferase [Bacillus sp. AK031]
MIKKLTREHYEESLNLSMYAFQYNVPEEERENRYKQIDQHELYGIEEGGKLAAKLHLLSLDVWLNGQEFSMGGIAGVATYPEYRRNGFVKELLTFSLNRMKEKGQTISMLHPFSVAFYRKYGWELFSSLKKVKVTQAEMSMFNQVPGFIQRFDKSDFPVSLETIYRHYSESFSGMLSRTKEWWKDRAITSLNVAVYHSEEGIEEGYILYGIKDQKMKVEEFVALNAESRSGLWNFICQHDSMVTEVELVLAPGDPLPYLLSNPRTQTEMCPYFMARVVDVKRFLGLYINTFKNEVSFSVSDKFAPWNNKTFTISDGKVLETETADCSVKMDINALVPLFFGVYSAKELEGMGVIEGTPEQISILDDNIKSKPGFFIDFF